MDVDASRTAMNITDATPVYTPGGGFTPQEMLDVVEAFYHKAIDEGYTGARGSGEMTWSLQEGLADVGDLLEYEAKLTGVLKLHPYTAVCQYDARRFSGEMIMDILSVHPVMIVRGQLVKNPHFIDPEQFLTEYRARRAG
ncbi:MAG: MEDS domain-containing protein [Phycisphaerae bacterium]|nr:MEDS domain-containing protein [Phycisphaerae bacterium]